MERTYKAILNGDRLEWMDPPPETEQQVEVSIVISEDKFKSKVDNKRAMAFIRKIAAGGGVSGIKDPVAWQREIRKDRPLPGRD